MRSTQVRVVVPAFVLRVSFGVTCWILSEQRAAAVLRVLRPTRALTAARGSRDHSLKADIAKTEIPGEDIVPLVDDVVACAMAWLVVDVVIAAVVPL